MRKALRLMLVAAFLLVACSSNTATPQATIVPEVALPVAVAQPTETKTVVAPPEVLTAVPSPDCTTIEAYPTPSEEEASVFPPVSADDLVFGLDDAAVTLIEYGDYQ